jgi:transmembrane serine protease 11D
LREDVVKVSYVAVCIGTSLFTLMSLATEGRAQSPCLSLDDMPAVAAATPRTVKTFREATPEALQAFLELSRDPSRRAGRIVDGEEVSFENNPWQVALVRFNVAEPRRQQFCGGSIIADDWVLTAAHCVQNSIVREDPARVDVVVGTPQWAIGGERIKVAQIHKHPNYNPSTMDQDFALLRLQRSQTLGQVIKTMEQNTTVSDGTATCVTGWGATFEGGPGSLNLLGAEVPVVSNDVCNRPESYDGEITANMMCAGREEGRGDSCQGDSGGPLSAQLDGRTTLVGVVSFGEGCARRLKYGVYSRVSAAAPWIASTMAGR